MIREGILNPGINALISRFRHTNTLVIADRGFPYWPLIETVDISLVDDIPTVLDVFRAIERVCVIGRIYMADEFEANNRRAARSSLGKAIGSIERVYEPHTAFKLRVPGAIGLIRTGDTIPYANMILESA